METFPSEIQKKIIDYGGSRLVVVAAPGTGKTATVVERMRKLVAEDPSRVVSFFTFTRASRTDTGGKVKRVAGAPSAEQDALELPRVTTLHQFAKGIVHRFAASLGLSSDFAVLDTVEVN